MADNFEKIPENLTDPSHVRNFLKDAINNVERKQYNLLFHAVYAILAAIAVYFASDSQAIPAFSTISTVLLFVAPAMCVFTFLYSPMYLKIIPVAIPAALIFTRLASHGFKDGFLGSASIVFIFILCLLSAAVITKAVLSGYTKTTLFVALSVVFGLICLCQTMFAFIASFGTFSFPLLIDTIDTALDNTVLSTVEYASTPEGLEALRVLAVSGSSLSDEQLIELVKESVQLSVSTVKPLLPSLFAFSCMFFGFVSVWVFSLFAKHFKINVFVCIMDKEWTYRPGVISASVYDIVFFAFILSMFISFPQNISVTVMNLLFVLTPLMFICGLRGIYSMFYRKKHNKIRSLIITALIVVFAIIITGAVAFLIISSVGVTFITARNREERLILPVKYASDLAALGKMSEDRNS